MTCDGRQSSMRLWLFVVIASAHSLAPLPSLAAPRGPRAAIAGSLARHARVACAADGGGEPPDDDLAGFEKFVDVSLGTISWAFLPLILFTGILLSPDFAAGRPIRIGAQSRDPLAFPVPAERRAPSGAVARDAPS